MSKVEELERLIAQGDWQAVDLAVRLDAAAWPAIQRGAGMEDFQSRQISMVCAGRLGGEAAATLLLAGLADKHINVSLAAAGQLSRNPPPSALPGILRELDSCQEDNICALLALALGHLPGEATTESLLELTGRDGDVAVNARLALAKLGHDEFLAAHLSRLASDDPYTRYEALAQLVYIDQAELAGHARQLLFDKEVAVTIGKQYTPRYRRVCDQALDTLAALLELRLPFVVSAESIYTDDQLSQASKMVR